MYNENDIKYEKFLKEYPGYGYLKVRVYSANEALPISDVNVLVSLKYDDEQIIFYSGKTDESGIVEKIKLPTPLIDENNLVKPNKLIYDLNVSYKAFNEVYEVAMYEGVCVIQNINIPMVENWL